MRLRCNPLFVVRNVGVKVMDFSGVQKFQVGEASRMTGWFAAIVGDHFGLSEFGIG